MNKNLIKKTLVISTILLFFGTVFLPIASSENIIIKNKSSSSEPRLSGWWYKMKITINHNQVVADLVNFPVLISFVSPHLGKRAQDDGDDIVFTDSSQDNILYHEIELFVDSTGQLVAWVNIPYLSSSQDTVIYMHYGNPDCGNQQNPELVWDNNFIAVYHLNGENYLAIDDSTSNNLDVIEQQGSPVFQQTGKIGYCVDFDEDSLNVDDNDLLSFTDETNQDKPFTIETWVKHDTTGGDINSIISKYANKKREWVLRKYLDDKCNLYCCDDSTEASIWRSTASSINVNNVGWNYISATNHALGSGSGIELILDGTTNNGETWTGPNYRNMENLEEKMRIGASHSHTAGWRYWAGFIDEVRISNIARSPGWLMTSYNTMNDPSSFIKCVRVKTRHCDTFISLMNIFEEYQNLLPIFRLLSHLF